MADINNHKELFKYLVDNFLLIGSHAWGGSKEFSDWDLAVNETRWHKIQKGLIASDMAYSLEWGMSGCETHTMYNIENVKLNCYFDNKKHILNIIVWKDEHFHLIEEFSKIMLYLKDSKLGEIMAKDKGHRINVVETILHSLFYDENRPNPYKATFGMDDEIPF